MFLALIEFNLFKVGLNMFIFLHEKKQDCEIKVYVFKNVLTYMYKFFCILTRGFNDID